MFHMVNGIFIIFDIINCPKAKDLWVFLLSFYKPINIIIMRVDKSFSNTSAKEAEVNVPDIKFFGNGDLWQLICKAWSEEEDWMKSTKAMEIPA